jgi:hypothetical protein
MRDWHATSSWTQCSLHLFIVQNNAVIQYNKVKYVVLLEANAIQNHAKTV